MTRVAPTLPADLAALHPDRWTAPFWEAALDHRLVAPRCTNCGTFRMPPGPFCWNCQHQDVDWVELSGRGMVFSFTVARQALIPILADAVPYVVALVDLDGAPGARLVTNVIDVDPDTVAVGMPVTVVWDDIHERTAIPRFVPA